MFVVKPPTASVLQSEASSNRWQMTGWFREETEAEMEKNELTDGPTDGPTDRRTGTDGRTDGPGPTDRPTDRPTDGDGRSEAPEGVCFGV